VRERVGGKAWAMNSQVMNCRRYVLRFSPSKIRLRRMGAFNDPSTRLKHGN